LKKILKYLLFLFLTPVHLFGQGFPAIMNYDLEDFGLFKQNYAIVQDSNGVIYVGNGQGIVSFDGVKWKWFHVPYSSHVLSLKYSENGIVYYGGENDFGFLVPDSINSVSPVSLRALAEERDYVIGDIWEIHETKGEIYFQTHKGFLRWDQKSLTSVQPNFDLYTSYELNGEIIVKERDGSFYRLKEKEFEKIEGLKDLEKLYPQVLLGEKDAWIIGTLNSGLYRSIKDKLAPLNTDKDFLLKKAQVYKGAWINDNLFALGSLSSGIFIFDIEGKLVNQLKVMNPEAKIPITDNTILELKVDNSGLLWSASGDGINKTMINIQYITFSNSSGLNGNINSIKVSSNKIFVGTDQGLFQSGFQPNYELTFKKVLEERVTKVSGDNGYLFVSGLKGIYQVIGDSVNTLFSGNVGDYEIMSSTTETIVYYSELNKVY